MSQMDKRCEKCVHNHDCKAVYESITKSKDASVTARVTIAFLLPLSIFVASMAFFNGILEKNTNLGALKDVVNLLISAVIAFVCAMTAKTIYNFCNKDPKLEGRKN